MAKNSESSFESKMQELENLVKELESGDVSLDDALDKYTKAMSLVKECSEKLTTVEKQVNKILSATGELKDFTVPE